MEGRKADYSFRDMLAFLLQSNGLPAGTQELKADSTKLKNIVKDSKN
jgi:hypothetical protein